MDTVLHQLSQISEVGIMYSSDILPNTDVRIVARNKTLGSVLDRVFSDSDLDFDIVGDQIVIYRNPYKANQQEYIVSGYITDAVSGERILYANVYTDDLAVGVGSNAYGFYNIALGPGQRVLSYSYLGYEKQSKVFDLTKDTVINVALKPKLELNEIVISAKRVLKARKSISESEKLSLTQLETLPALGGEPDIMRLAQVQTGVTTGSDGTGGLNVRGGSLDQNLIMLDGVPIYNAGHALGIFSVFNSSMIKSAELIKNGFPARYGGRLSSVLDIRTKDGDMSSFKGQLGISPVAGRLTLEGPIIKEKASFVVSARRSILDVWLRQVDRLTFLDTDQLSNLDYYFTDFNAKVNFEINSKNKFYLSLYQGADRFSNEDFNESEGSDESIISDQQKTRWDWGNRLATLRWNSIITNRLFVNFFTYFSEFEVDLFELDRQVVTSDIGQNFFYQANLSSSKIQDIGGGLESEYRVSSPYSIFFGANYTRHDFQPATLSVTEDDDLVPLDQEITLNDLQDSLGQLAELGTEYRAYMEHQIETGRLSLNAGLHLSAIFAGDAEYISLQPRFSADLDFGKGLSWQTAYSRMNQFLHLLSNTGLGLPNDIWLPSTARLSPQTAEQYSTGFTFNTSKGYEISLGGYYKQMNDLISQPSEDAITIVQAEDWESQIPVGDGQAYGLEISTSRNIGALTGFVNYTYSFVDQQFDDRVNRGLRFPARYDRRHNINMALRWALSENFEIASNWSFGTGSPFTLPTEFSFIELPDGGVIINAELSEINNARLEDYHRLDIAFNYYKTIRLGRQKLSLSVYNAYNRLNTFYIDYRRTELRNNSPIFEKVSIFPILPSISYNLSF